MPIDPQVFNNTILIAAVVACFTAQILKVLINMILVKEFNIGLLFSSGGFPSSHSAAVSALAFEIGKFCGWGSPLFAIAAVFGTIVLYDATGVRRETGRQAEVLNHLLGRLYNESTRTQEYLKELVGHTPFEVLGGVIVGIIVGQLI